MLALVIIMSLTTCGKDNAATSGNVSTAGGTNATDTSDAGTKDERNGQIKVIGLCIKDYKNIIGLEHDLQLNKTAVIQN
jgi:hypothetical protein